MTMFPGLTHVVAIKIDDVRHLVDRDDPTYSPTLCGLPAGYDFVLNRSGAGRLPLCQACDAEDLRREPKRNLRFIDR